MNLIVVTEMLLSEVQEIFDGYAALVVDVTHLKDVLQQDDDVDVQLHADVINSS